MEDCIHDEGRALRADGDALWTIECTEHIRATNDHMDHVKKALETRRDNKLFINL
jgi:hypothetical protein